MSDSTEQFSDPEKETGELTYLENRVAARKHFREIMTSGGEGNHGDTGAPHAHGNAGGDLSGL